MCGIGGVIAIDKERPFSRPVQKSTLDLLKSLETRGRDAWGVFLKHKDEKYNLNCWKPDDTIEGELFKIDGSVSDFFEKRDGKIDTKNLIIALMHTRAATTGESTEIKNNHPFATKDFILAHNGTITNHLELKNEYKLQYDEETDSAVIVSLIQKFYDEGNTVLDSIKKTAELLNGGFACWLYDKNTDEVYLFKKTNPITFAVLNRRNVIVFASESTMLTTAFGIEYSDVTTISEGDIYLISDTIKKIGDLPDSISNYPYYQNQTKTTGTQRLTDYSDMLVRLFEVCSEYSSSSDTLKITRVYTEVIILTSSEDLLNAVSKSSVGATIVYLNDRNGKYYRITVSLEKCEYLLDDLTVNLLNNQNFKTILENDFEGGLTVLGEELGFDWTETQESYILHKNEQKLKGNGEELFKGVGLSFSKKGVLTIVKNSYAHRKLMELIKKYISEMEVSY